jgi:signal transduction histidine kinase
LLFGDLTEQAIKRGDDDKALQYLTSVLAAIDRARTLTRQMLGFVALPPDDVAPIPVAEALSPARAILGVVARTITWTVPDAVATVAVTADSTGLMQILLNIVRNAINAGGEATAIDIRVAALDAEAGKPAMIAISVTDDGPGIEPDDLVKIFEPRFTRRAAHYSAGLGLPIARSIAERWGGGLDAESAPGQGATFHIRLCVA